MTLLQSSPCANYSQNLSCKTALESVTLLQTNATQGLATAEANKRLGNEGPNDIPEKQENPLLKFASKFWGLSAWMIELIAVLSWILGKHVDFIVALALLILNAVISFIEEKRASGAVAALRDRLHVMGRVLRDGKWQLLSARNLVCGDIIRVRVGDFVPADAQIIEGQVDVDQSALTGESQKIEKQENSFLSSGSIIKNGEATAVVTATGSRTYYGRTTQLVESAHPKLHIEDVIGNVVHWLVAIVGVQILLVIGLSFVKGLPFSEVIPLSLVLLMSAIPVALPVMFTVTMALGAMDLARNGVLVTRLSTTEDAAHMDVLCADKTGTLTHNQLSLTAVEPQPHFSEQDVIMCGAYASNEADQDAIDLAFLQAAQERHLLAERIQHVSFIPFTPKTRHTEAIIEKNQQRYRILKGALRTICEDCHIKESAIADFEKRADQAAKKGIRVIAVARAEGQMPLMLVGLAFFYDAPRSDSQELIHELKSLGVEVKMLTGDALPIAEETARLLGLGKIMRIAHNNSEKKSLLNAEYLGDASTFGGYAEVYPEDKFSVVKSLQKTGHIVGMTGDGVNDAPALRQAEIGVAVSGATDVAKSAASAVLTTEGLVGIVALIKNGRAIYQRILSWTFSKISRALLQSAVIVIVFLCTGKFVISAFGLVLLLFMTDFVKISLATDRVRPSSKPETWEIRPLVQLSILVGLLMVIESLLFFVGTWRALGFSGNTPLLQACTFQLFLFFALFSLLSIRERRFFWSSYPSRILGTALFADGLLGVLIGQLGIGEMAAIPGSHLLLILGYTAFCSLTINDRIKAVFIRWFWPSAIEDQAL